MQRSIRDPQTGLFDRDAFAELASDRLERSSRSAARTAIAVFELDLVDGASRRLPIDVVARAIRESIRPSDLAARTSETTFIALLDRCDREEAKHVCARILRSLMRMDALGSVTCGISVAPNDGSSLDHLVASATRRQRPGAGSDTVIAAAS